MQETRNSSALAMELRLSSFAKGKYVLNLDIHVPDWVVNKRNVY